MRVISRKAFRTFSGLHPESEEVFNDFFHKLRRVDARSFTELRQTFSSADILSDCIVFNVGGNNYRVIAHLDFSIQALWVRYVLTHAEYDRGKWKSDC